MIARLPGGWGVFNWHFSRVLRRIAEIALVAIVYLLVAKASLEFASIHPSASPVWPPAGLALGLTLLRGYRVLPAIFMGAFAANAESSQLPVSVIIAAGNTLEALAGAYLINLWAKGREAFQSSSGIAKFALIVACSALISATIGVSAIVFGGDAAPGDYPAIWATWWLGNVAGAVMITPAIVLCVEALQRPREKPDRAAEFVALLAAAIAVGAVAFGPVLPSTPGRNALAFLAVIPLLWAALRHRTHHTSLIALILSAFALWGAALGKGPFVQETLNASFLLLVSFIASVTLPSLALSTAVAGKERVLARREQDHRLLIDSVRDYAIYMLTVDGNVATWNSGAARIKLYPESEIVGRHFSCFYTDEDRLSGEPQRALARAAEIGKYEAEGWRVRRDGSRFWAQVTINAICAEDGRLIGFAKVTRDVTETRAVQSELKHTRELLQHSQKLEALGQLTGSVAHDFNNLLAVIAGGLHVLEKNPAPELSSTVLVELRRALEHGGELTKQLLSFARKEKPSPELVDLADCVGRMRGILDRLFGPKVQLSLNFPTGLPPVFVERAQLESALLNLTINARDAMPLGGAATIAAEATGEGTVRLSLRDTGVGMAPEVMARVFEPFFSTKEPGRGTGLGLSQVATFARQAGGSAEVESQTGAGTIFTLVLPTQQS